MLSIACDDFKPYFPCVRIRLPLCLKPRFLKVKVALKRFISVNFKRQNVKSIDIISSLDHKVVLGQESSRFIIHTVEPLGGLWHEP